MSKRLFSGLGLLLLIATVPAQALTLGFTNITNNNPGDAAIGEAQLLVDVTEGANAGLVDFTFRNLGPEDSSIVQTYWDDRTGVLNEIDSIINGTGVMFDTGATPGHLPGGGAVDFEVNPMGALADADAPKQPNGVNPGELVTIIFSLASGKTFDDVLASIGLAGVGTGLRMGIHVQGFASGGSESFVTPGDMSPVPIPAAFPLFLTGLLGLRFYQKRRTANAA